MPKTLLRRKIDEPYRGDIVLYYCFVFVIRIYIYVYPSCSFYLLSCDITCDNRVPIVYFVDSWLVVCTHTLWLE